MRYKVIVYREICHSGTIEVDADSKEEAEILALDAASMHVLPHKYPTEYKVLSTKQCSPEETAIMKRIV